ncbi:hypothetical protein U9M48_042637 [Paspalum notatum var. saurae]|uniref:Uncharacterized protein n=1 Tax=Paspalum notatum var. saurae TaxID=547442 RepID=A0AAQ3XGC9_PASNO
MEDEPYDADGDVSRFLHCPSPEAHLFSLSEPEGSLTGLFQNAPPITAEAQSQPAQQTENAAPDSGHRVPTVHAEGYQAPIVDAAAEHYQAPPAIVNSVEFQATTAINDADHFQASTINAGEHYQAAPPVINDVEHYQVPIVDAEYHQAPTMMDVDAMDIQPTHMMDSVMHQGLDFPVPTSMLGDGENYQPPTINAEHYQTATNINAEHHQAPAMDVVGHYQQTHMMDSEMRQGQGFPDPTSSLHGNGEHCQAPTINAEHFQTGAIVNAEHHQLPAMDAVEYYQPMAMDIQPTHMLAPVPEMHEAYDFPDPTPTLGDGGVNSTSLFEGNNMLADGVIPPPSPPLYEQLMDDGEEDLAAIVRDIEAGDNVGGAGASAGAGAGAGAALDVCPVEEPVVFKQIRSDQLDCSRCRSVREILQHNGINKVHLFVHSADPGTFQHAIVDRMSIGADGQFHRTELLYLDLRRRTHEWVLFFITRSVEIMKTRNPGPLQDTCSSYCAAGCTDMAAPAPSNHGHMELEVDMLKNILSETGADPAASVEAAQPAVPQEQANINEAPCVAEAAPPEAANLPAAPPEAANLPVAPQEEENTMAAPVTQAAAPDAVQPAVTQEQPGNTTDAPQVAEAAAPDAAQPAVSQQEANKDELKFPPFNWEGFQPEILESSHVKPYDPASGENVLMYPSLLEQLRKSELERRESKRLSKMPVQDTTKYLNMDKEDRTKEPKLGSSAPFKRLCEKNGAYRLYWKRINGLNRKITKLEQTVNRVGTKGLFALKQKMDLHKREKAALYDMIMKGIQENERGNNGAGPSNRAAGNSSPAATSKDATTSNKDAAATPSNATNPSNDPSPILPAAGPSNRATGNSSPGATSKDVATSNKDAAATPSSASNPSNDPSSILPAASK